jgi:acyl-CoA synthetase (AMP-forming)/AMP-acid ligase II
VEGDIYRYTFRDATVARSDGNALTGLGVTPSARIGTLAWNGYRYLELYYGVSGMGAILHTINPRLHEDQVAYIANHAEDQYVFFDLTFLPLIKAVAGRCKTVKAFIAMADHAHMPKDAGIDNLLCRRPDRAGFVRLFLADPRRGRRQYPLLHLGHDGQPERGPVQPSLIAAAHLCGRAA